MDTPYLVGYRWEGYFDVKAFQEAVELFLPELNKRERFNIYIEVTNIEGVEAKALWEDIKFSLEHLGEYRRKISKVALVSEDSWMRNLIDMANVFVPDVRLKSFTFSDVDAARSFADTL